MNLEIHLKYSKALYECSITANKENKIFEEVNYIKNVFNENTELYNIFISKFITPTKKIKLIEKIFKGKIDEIIVNFLIILIKNKKELFLLPIISSYIDLYYKKNNFLEVKVITSQLVSDEFYNNLKIKLERVLKKNILLKKEINEKIIGGLIIQFNGKEYDYSIKRHFEKIKDKIVSKELYRL